MGKIDALNVGSVNGDREDILTDWRAILAAGFRVPLAGGSAKLSNKHLLGSPRTYARLQPGQEFTYKAWIEAVRAGRTFVTNGPLLSFHVNGQDSGAVQDVPSSAARINVRAEVRSLFPIHRLEVVCNGAVVGSAETSGSPAQAVVEMDLPVDRPAWLGASCRGIEDSQQSEVYWAHSSPVYIQIDGKRLQPNASTSAPLFAWLDKVHHWVAQEATCRDEQRRQRLLAVFESAKQELLRRQAS
jgi:hypothetical protein